MDSEASSRQVCPPFSQPLMLHQKRHEGDLPIMHMNHFGLPGQKTGQMCHALREEDEALCVVRIINSVLLV